MGLKNFSFYSRKLSSSDRGLYSEYLVYQYFIAKKFKLVAHRLKTPVAEVDLLFRSDAGAGLLVEVKSLSDEEFLVNRIGRRQKQKLVLAGLYLEKYFSEIELVLAVVRHDASIEIFDEVWS